MFPAQFDYRPASSVDEALEALVRYGDDARVLAGGQSLIPAMRFRLARPAVLVDINPIDGARLSARGRRLTADRRHDARLSRSKPRSMLADRYRLIADAAVVVADPVVRQMGTVVGSLCHNDPAGDWPVVALAAARRSWCARKTARERFRSTTFIVDSYTTAVGDGEMAVEVRFPTPVSAYVRLVPKDRTQSRRLRDRRRGGAN